MSITYSFENDINLIVHDDGKANAFSADKFRILNRALDQAQANMGSVIITGRDNNFSAGYDLNELLQGPEAALKILKEGALLCLRLLQFPYPVICACNGHAYPMGAFILMSSDYRLGVKGDYLLGMNEVRIGITPPQYAIEVARGRLSPPYLNRTITTGEMFSPLDAQHAGIIDELVDTTDLMPTALAKAEEFKGINMRNHGEVKLKLRMPWIEKIKRAIDEELTFSKAEKMFNPD